MTVLPAVFISHSTDDADLAAAFVRVLQAAFNIPDGRIRCTAVGGYGLPAGVHVAETLRAELIGADSCLAILTPSSLKSSYVLFELGARWAVGKHVVPVLARGARQRSVTGPIAELNVVPIESEPTIYTVLSRFADLLGSPPVRSREVTRAVRSAVRLAADQTQGNVPRERRTNSLDADVIIDCFDPPLMADGGYIDPEIPPVVASNARARFVSGRERILVFVDNSRAGVDGLAVTARGVYWRNTQHSSPKFLGWRELAQMEIGWKRYDWLLLGDERVDLSFRSVRPQYVAESLRACVARWRRTVGRNA